MRGTVVDISDVVRRMMDELGIDGSFDVRADGSRSTGWVGKPGDQDHAVVMTITPLPPIGDAAEQATG